MNDQPYGDIRGEYDHFEPRQTEPVPPWNPRAYEHETTPATDQET